jgi:hypothetical protein
MSDVPTVECNDKIVRYRSHYPPKQWEAILTHFGAIGEEDPETNAALAATFDRIELAVTSYRLF